MSFAAAGRILPLDCCWHENNDAALRQIFWFTVASGKRNPNPSSAEWALIISSMMWNTKSGVTPSATWIIIGSSSALAPESGPIEKAESCGRHTATMEAFCFASMFYRGKSTKVYTEITTRVTVSNSNRHSIANCSTSVSVCGTTRKKW